MSHHEVHTSSEVDHEEMDSNSRADAIAILSLVVIIVAMAVFYVSR
ncbi:MAG: hypothetical protein Q8L60_13385 [Gammaproteobacteria bacterium]|nr:hypothetical protein [Gammaproteobacteria bacterium]MDP2141106.1 hypothetical protein [Gammaproteobacteria bacterium]MDP2349219.1 hypothetical protein [Gammaproteobacteria bacterium]